MQIFLTGGTGYIGGAAVRALLDAGHAVTALARSADGAAPRARALGWEPRTASFAAGAAAACHEFCALTRPAPAAEVAS